MGKKIIKKGEYYVYVYLDPKKPGEYMYSPYSFNFEPIYVGKGKRKRAYYFEKRNIQFQAKLIEIGKPFIVLVGDSLTESSAFSLEKELIAKMGRLCKRTGPLCNISDGGEGASGCVRSEESKNRYSKAAMGRKLSEETKRKISNTMIGIHRSEEVRNKISKTLSGRILSEDHKKKISNSIREWQKSRQS